MATTEKERPEMPEPQEVARTYAEVAQRASKLIGEHIQRQLKKGVSAPADELGVAQAFMDMMAKLLANPYKLAQAQMNLVWDYFSLWQHSMLRVVGMPAPAPVATPAKDDKRFKDEEWQDHFLFDFIKQSYLISARHIHDTVCCVEGLDEQSQKKVSFFTRQYIDALSPSNFALTNPEVFRETVKSHGQNLVKGLNNLLRDVEEGGGNLRVKMTDTSAFELGKNVATTPGKVIFQNDMMQLLQYTPSTAYVLEGVIAALDAIEKQTGEKEVNAAGYCLGGTLLATSCAYLAANKQKRIASATFFTTMTDFSEPGELGVFIDEGSISGLEKKMFERGFLEGSEMAGTFNMMRANDLIWSFVVNNYLMGKDPFPFDLLYWNSDSTRMPAKMHSFYLRNMYLQNRLVEPGGIEIDGTPIDLAKIKIPCYFVSTIEDHIAPWKSTYMGARNFGGPTRFVLGGSGHIAGIVTPPVANKYGFWVNPAPKLAATADEWFADAQQQPGSWWTDWQAWVTAHDADRVPPRDPAKGKLKALEDAPGSYVKIRADSTQAA